MAMEVVGPPECFGCNVKCVAFTPDSRHVVVGLMKYEALVLSAPTWKVVAKIALAGAPSSVTCSVGEENLLAIGDYGCAVSVVRVQDLACHTIATHKMSDKALSVRFSPSGRRLLVGDYQGVLQLLESPTWHVARQVKLGGGIPSVAFSPQGDWIAAASFDKTLQLIREPRWGKRESQLLPRHPTVVAFSPHEGEWLAAGDASGCVSVLGLRRAWLDGSSPSSAEQEESPWFGAGCPQLQSQVKIVQFAPCGTPAIAAGGGDRMLAILTYSSPLWEVSSSIELPGTMQNASFTPDGRHLAVCASRGGVQLFAVSNWRAMQEVELSSVAHHLACSPDGRWLVAASAVDNRMFVLAPRWRLQLQASNMTGMLQLADEGCAFAQYCSGIALAQGCLGDCKFPKDLKHAARRLREAAAQGIAGGGRVEDRLLEFHSFEGESFPRNTEPQAVEMWNLIASEEARSGPPLGGLIEDFMMTYRDAVHSLATRSISLMELFHFRDANAQRILCATTREIVTEIIIPLTKEAKVSYVDFLNSKGSREVREPDFHVIHAWGMRFIDLLVAAAQAASAGVRTSLEAYDYSHEELQTRFWICAFCINQPRAICCQADQIPRGAPDYEMDKFENVLRHLHTLDKKAIFVLDQRNLAKDRIWCLDEVHECQRTGIELRFFGNCRLQSMQRCEFKSVRHCHAFDPRDKERILRKIENNFTIEAFDNQLFLAISAGIQRELDRVRSAVAGDSPHIPLVRAGTGNLASSPQSFEALIARIEALERRTARIDELERKAARVDELERKAAKVDKLANVVWHLHDVMMSTEDQDETLRSKRRLAQELVESLHLEPPLLKG